MILYSSSQAVSPSFRCAPLDSLKLAGKLNVNSVKDLKKQVGPPFNTLFS